MKFQQVYFVVDDSLRLLWIGGEWDEFALANGGSNARSNEVLSTSLLAHITDGLTRDATAAMAKAVKDTHEALRIDYRCDSPTLMRRYLMTIQPMKDDRVLFVHDLRDVQTFANAVVHWRFRAGAGDLKCSFCCSVRMTDSDWTPPEELADAGRIDGCTEFGIYWRIMLPLSKPALATVAIFTFLAAWNDYIGPLLYLRSDYNFTVAIGLATFRGVMKTEWNLLMAASTAMILPVILLFFFAQRYFVDGLVLSGLKG